MPLKGLPPDQHFARPLEPAPVNKLRQRGRGGLRPPARQAGQAREHRVDLLKPDVRAAMEGKSGVAAVDPGPVSELRSLLSGAKCKVLRREKVPSTGLAESAGPSYVRAASCDGSRC